MKRIGLLMMVLVLALSFVSVANAGLKIYGLTGAGTYFQSGGKAQFAYFGGANVPNFTDTVRNYQVITRGGVLVCSGYGVNGAQAYELVKKTLGVGHGLGQLYAVFGGGILWQMSNDKKLDGAIKAELGYQFTKLNVSAAVTVDYRPGNDAEKDVWYVGGILDLSNLL